MEKVIANEMQHKVGDMGGSSSIIQDSQSQPLFIPLVAQSVFSNLKLKDLLQVRRVCSEWYTVSTATYIRRTIEPFKPADEHSCQVFMDLMSESTRVPVVGYSIHVDIRDSSSTGMNLKFLASIAPFARRLFVPFDPTKEDGDGSEEGVAQILSLLKDLVPEGFEGFPELEELSVDAYPPAWNTPPYRDVVTTLCRRIVDGGKKGIHTFRSTFPFESRDGVVQALSPSLQRMKLYNTITLKGRLPDMPYSVFSNSGFQLKELADARSNLRDLGLFDFFSSIQGQSLSRLFIEYLEDTYRESYPHTAFPQLKSVEQVTCDVNCSSTYEFLQPFPCLIELIVVVKPLYSWSKVKDRRQDILANLQTLPNHPTVRKLDISPYDCEIERIEEDVDISILAHCFPNLTHFSIAVGLSARILTDVFTHFPNLEWLYIDFYNFEHRAEDWVSVLSGIPVQVCKDMDAADDYDEADEGTYGIGLTNLKKLKILEITDDSETFDFIFKKLMFHRVFKRMESLKEIRCVDDRNDQDYLPYYPACDSLIEGLSEAGIDLYRMKWVINA